MQQTKGPAVKVGPWEGLSVKEAVQAGGWNAGGSGSPFGGRQGLSPDPWAEENRRLPRPGKVAPSQKGITQALLINSGSPRSAS